MTLTSKTIEVKGRPIEILQGGRGQPLVFLHGGGYVEGVDFLDQLTDRYQVVAPLLPGYGDSELEPPLAGRQGVTEHLLDVLDVLGLERVVLVGHSLGGWRAASFAAAHPERVVRLVLAAPAGMAVQGHPMTNMLAHTPEERRQILTASSSVWEGRIPAEPDAEFVAKRTREMKSMAAFSPGLQDAEIHSVAQSVAVETLILWGERDRLIPIAHAEAWKAAIPNATLRTFPDTGHLLFHEQGEAVEAIGGA